MNLATPKEPVIYYECSNGQFRLMYCLPAGICQDLVAEGKIADEVLQDFPDGLDVACSNADFTRLQEDYGYQPDVTADELRAAFLAMFSETRGWKTFRGSGLIALRDLIPVVDEVKEVAPEVTEEPETDEATAKGFLMPTAQPLSVRRRKKVRAAKRRKKAISKLEKMKVEKVDSKRSLHDQRFSKIRMEEGQSSEEFFNQLYQKQKNK